MSHLWRSSRGTRYHDEWIPVTQQDDLTVRRGWGGRWQYCFSKRSRPSTKTATSNSSSIRAKRADREQRQRAHPEHSRRQPPWSRPADSGDKDQTTDSSVNAATQIISPVDSNASSATITAIESAALPNSGTVITEATPATASSNATRAPSTGSIQNKAQSGPSERVRVGLGVGFGLGVPLLLLLIAAVFFVRRNRRRRTNMESKYAPQAQSELSMAEPTYPVPAGPPRSAQGPEIKVIRHSQAYYEPPAPMHDSLDTPVSAITQRDAPPYSERDALQQRLSLKIPGSEVESVRSVDLSPAHGRSPVSPVSPVSAITQARSRSPSPKSS